MGNEFEKLAEEVEKDNSIGVGEEVILQTSPGIFRAFVKKSCTDGTTRLFVKRS